MLAQLRQKALNFNNILEDHEASIEDANRELKRVKEMLIDAQAARDKAKEQLNENEEALIKQRRQRERELQDLRQRAEEKRGAEAIERRVTRQSLSRTGSTPNPIDHQVPDQKQQQTSSADLEAKLQYYEAIYQKIKDATGVSSIVEAVSRFESQGETAKHLAQLKSENETKLEQLQQDKILLKEKFNMLQYSDSEPVAKIDSELKSAQDELSELVKSKHDYQEQLEKQNSGLYIIKLVLIDLFRIIAQCTQWRSTSRR